MAGISNHEVTHVSYYILVSSSHHVAAGPSSRAGLPAGAVRCPAHPAAVTSRRLAGRPAGTSPGGDSGPGAGPLAAAGAGRSQPAARAAGRAGEAAGRPADADAVPAVDGVCQGRSPTAVTTGETAL